VAFQRKLTSSTCFTAWSTANRRRPRRSPRLKPWPWAKSHAPMSSVMTPCARPRRCAMRH